MSLAVRPNSHKRMYASTAVNNDSAVHRQVNGAQEMQHSIKPIMRVWEVMSSCIIHSLRGRLHGRVVPAKRVDSLCRVDPLPLCIVYYFDISITCKASCPALPGPRL